MGHDAADGERVLRPAENNINFPAGILQPPFYDAERDDAVNYGAIGAVIGHELTHGFDDQGRQFDARGQPARLVDAGRRRRPSRSARSCVATSTAATSSADDVQLNGKLTLGENIADNGGLRLALMALFGRSGQPRAAKLDGFTPEQRFFLGWAQVWCENARPEFARLQAPDQSALAAADTA